VTAQVGDGDVTVAVADARRWRLASQGSEDPRCGTPRVRVAALFFYENGLGYWALDFGLEVHLFADGAVTIGNESASARGVLQTNMATGSWVLTTIWGDA
ncbi:hypothetical protein Gohar_003768, partial [Gossypium harknessii]|nr:hypothetical protein [Gossypium harknessii]